METPLCGCHGQPCYWHKDQRKVKGGSWRCRVARRAYDAARWQRYEERMPPAVRIRKNLSRQLADNRRTRAARATPANPKLVQALRTVKREGN